MDVIVEYRDHWMCVYIQGLDQLSVYVVFYYLFECVFLYRILLCISNIGLSLTWLSY